MDLAADSIVPLAAVTSLAVVTLGFAMLIGRWIDRQSQKVVKAPRRGPRKLRGEGDATSQE